MRKAYLFAYNPSLGSRDEVKSFVSNCELIKTWRGEITNTFFLISESGVEEICEKIRLHFGNKGTYIVTEINDYQGRLVERSWSLLSDKKLPPKKKS